MIHVVPDIESETNQFPDSWTRPAMILIPHWVRPSAEQVDRLSDLLIGEVPTRAGSNGRFQRALSQEALTPIPNGAGTDAT